MPMPFVVLLGLIALQAAHPQSPANSNSPFTFDVASVKPTPAGERGGIVHQPPGGHSYEAVGVGKGPVEFLVIEHVEKPSAN